MRKGELKNMIAWALENIPETRDSDIRLCIEIWCKYFPTRIITGEVSGEKAVRLRSLYDLPREDNVKRLRAHFQNVEGKWLPTSWAVAKQRRINEERWREYMGTLAGYASP